METGYFIEQMHSQIYIVDETDQDNPMPYHATFISPLKVWKEEYVLISSEEKEEQKKVIFYEVEDKLTKKKDFFAVTLNPDQNLSSISVQTTKKEIDPVAQQTLSRVILFISISLNILLMALTMNDENFILKITMANAGWVIAVMLLLKIIDLNQQKPAIYAAVYTLVKSSIYHPVLKKRVQVKYVTVLISDKVRISDTLPMQIERIQVQQALDLAEKNEQRYIGELEKRENLEKIIQTQNERLRENEQREKLIMKESYARGVKHASTKISTKAPAKEVFKEYKYAWIGASILLASIIIAPTFKILAEKFPNAVFIVNLSDLPWFVWLIVLLFAWFLFMGFYNLFFGRLR